MSLATLLPMPFQSATTPLRHPSHRSPRQKVPSPTFVDRWRDRQRADLEARVKFAREKSATAARGGEDEMMGVIFRGEEKRRLARMEKEATLIHRETLDHFDEVEDGVDPDEVLLEELLRKEEEEVLALLAAREQAENEMLDMEDVVMSDVEVDHR